MAVEAPLFSDKDFPDAKRNGEYAPESLLPLSTISEDIAPCAGIDC